MKKIAILIAHLGNGGAERVSVNLANALAEKKYDVTAIIFHRGDEEYKLTDSVKTIYLENADEKPNTFKKIIRLRKNLKKIKPDYVIELGFAMAYIIVGGLINKYKYIFSMRNDPQMSMKNAKTIFAHFGNYYFRHAKNVVFQTADAKAYYPEDIQAKGVIIPNPIKINLPERFAGERKHIIVAFSRLNKQKNIPMMLDAFKLFLHDFPDYKLKIYGRGEELENLQQYAQQLQIESSVEFCGFSRNIHKEILDNMMYVSSSDYEGISNSMIEALGIGMPCLCTDCPAGGARMFIEDGVNGLLSPVGDAQLFYENMVKLASNPELCEKFSQNAVKIKETLSSSKIADQWEALIK